MKYPLTVTALILGLLTSLCAFAGDAPVLLNDIHSQLNPTAVAEVRQPRTETEIRALLLEAKHRRLPISMSGGRHSMGGQQFAAGALHLDLSSYNQVSGFKAETEHDRAWVEVESGIQWPELIAWLQKNAPDWTIRQKQTGADRLSLGGALSSNIHGRGLKMKPFIDDIESFDILDAEGRTRVCSRTQNTELFRLAIGGYGLFGVVTKIRLRLAKLTTLERVVQLVDLEDFIPLVNKQTNEGALYGDFQFSIDPESKDFLKRGVASLYRPVEAASPLALPPQKELGEKDWISLLGLAHTDKAKAFDVYSKYYLSTNGQRYRSDTHQLGVYVDDYHRNFLHSDASEMISEIYVPREKLSVLFARLREDFRKNEVNVIYGTVRLIEPDRESFLAWAKEDYAATVFNFHVEHTPEGIKKAERDFRLIIDRALELGGNYYLTYHRWARRDQVLKAYPQMPQFLALKEKYDPEGRFQSDWYRAVKKLVTETN